MLLTDLPRWVLRRRFDDETVKSKLAATADTGALPYVTGLKNLTLTGDQILPVLGLEGALAAGWSAAKVACALAGKKKDYLRDEVVGAA